MCVCSMFKCLVPSNRIPICDECVLLWYVTCYVCVIKFCRFSSFYSVFRFVRVLLFAIQRILVRNIPSIWNVWFFYMYKFGVGVWALFKNFSSFFLLLTDKFSGSGPGEDRAHFHIKYNIWSRLCTKFHKCADVISILPCHSKKFYTHFEFPSPLTNNFNGCSAKQVLLKLLLFHHPHEIEMEKFQSVTKTETIRRFLNTFHMRCAISPKRYTMTICIYEIWNENWKRVGNRCMFAPHTHTHLQTHPTKKPSSWAISIKHSHKYLGNK